ncbi:MAG: helix-turn-helix domain-containing protein [Chloroflexi bacterium]|nr:helix-turn-helix domain-containing protein [Chloroflexota bacterium]
MSRDLNQYVTTKQAAVLLGVVPDHVYRLLEGEKIQALRLGHEWLIYVPSLEKYQVTKSKRGRPASGTPQLGNGNSA